MPWDRCLAANGRIDINIMPAAMPGQDAASLLKLLYQFFTLQSQGPSLDNPEEYPSSRFLP